MVTGQFRKGTDIIEGIARQVTFSNQIQEGLFRNGKLNGYGRFFLQSGRYYVGMVRDHKYNGQGKFVQVDGQMQIGLFKNDKFVGSGASGPPTAPSASI